jgi:hypothetical protein
MQLMVVANQLKNKLERFKELATIQRIKYRVSTLGRITV